MVKMYCSLRKDVDHEREGQMHRVECLGLEVLHTSDEEATGMIFDRVKWDVYL